MFKTARRWRWVSENPLELVEPPSMPDHETETLTAAEIASVLKAYRCWKRPPKTTRSPGTPPHDA